MSGRNAFLSRGDRRHNRRAFGQIRHVYRCNLCLWHIVTVQIEDGIVPKTIGCRNPEGCKSTATEYLGDPRPWPAGVPWAPAFQWTEPTIKELDDSQKHGGPMWDHLSKRGLMLRNRPGYRR